jgi:hypothetical protein
MNIFYIHRLARICAIMHVDKHVVKMILETAQILCTTHHVTNSSYKPPYKPTHKNHPCTVWARKSIGNYKWLVQLGLELCKEYTHRYKKIHKSQQYIEEMSRIIPEILPDLGFTTPEMCMPDEYKSKNVVDSYRQYYYFEKYHLHSWKNREIPEWITEIKDMFED